MSKEADLAIKAVLDKHGEAWTEGTVWRVQGTAVIAHKALERIAARAGIRFDLPTIIRAERDEAVILVAGFLGEAREWSIGECAVNQNYRVSGKMSAYPFAMSEKRAKDRVILKLLQLHGLAYSEEEADDFRHGAQPASNKPQAVPDEEPGDARQDFIDSCVATIRNAKSGPDLRDWWKSEEHLSACADFDLTKPEVDRLKDLLSERLQQIGKATDTPPAAKANGHGRHEEARVQ